MLMVAFFAIFIIVDLAAADHLHLMQRRVELTEEGRKSTQFQTFTECGGGDCDLSTAKGVAALAQGSTATQTDVADVKPQSKNFKTNAIANSSPRSIVQSLSERTGEEDGVAKEIRDGGELKEASVQQAGVDEFMLAHQASVERRMNSSSNAEKHQSPDTLHVYPIDGQAFMNWSLCNRSYRSNFGGMGPNYGGEEAVRFFNVATMQDSDGTAHQLDLVIETIGAYLPQRSAANGVFADSCFGQINLKAIANGTRSVTLRLNWYLAGTTTHVVPNRYYFTYYDVDGTETLSEAITFYNRVHDVYLSENTDLTQSGELESGLTLSAEGLTNNVANPTDPESLTDEQMRRSVTVSYLEKSQIKLTFSISGDGGAKGGRNLIFAGHSALAPPVQSVLKSGCEETGSCSIYEDPHIKVFDGMQISLLSTQTTKRRRLADYGPGDWWLVKSPDVSIQGRYLPDPGLPEGNLFVRSVAIGGPFLNGSTMILGPLNGEITWNKVPVLETQVSNFEVELGTGQVKARRHTKSHLVQDMTQTNAGVDIDLPNGVKMTVNRYKSHVNLFISMRPDAGGQEGLCGNFNCIASDDALGMILTHRSPKVRPGDSLFDQ